MCGVCLHVLFLLLFLTSVTAGAGPFALVARAEAVSFAEFSLGGSGDMGGRRKVSLVGRFICVDWGAL